MISQKPKEENISRKTTLHRSNVVDSNIWYALKLSIKI